MSQGIRFTWETDQSFSQLQGCCGTIAYQLSTAYLSKAAQLQKPCGQHNDFTILFSPGLYSSFNCRHRTYRIPKSIMVSNFSWKSVDIRGICRSSICDHVIGPNDNVHKKTEAQASRVERIKTRLNGMCALINKK